MVAFQRSSEQLKVNKLIDWFKFYDGICSGLGRAARLDPRPRRRRLCHGGSRESNNFFWAAIMGCSTTSCPNLKAQFEFLIH